LKLLVPSIISARLDRRGGGEVHGDAEDERGGRDLHQNPPEVSQRPSHSQTKVLHFVSFPSTKS